MRKLFFVVIIILSNKLFAQLEITAGMGIGFVNNSSVADYVNLNFAANGKQLKSFNSAIDFYLEADYSISNSFQLGLEYDEMYFSYTNLQTTAGDYELNYYHHKPSLVAFYVFRGTGYNFKFGGGAGPRFISLEEKLPLVSARQRYKSSGVGLLLKGQGNTLLGGNFYANIAVDLRYDFPGEPEDEDGQALVNNSYQENVNVNSLTFGLKLGVSYFF